LIADFDCTKRELIEIFVKTKNLSRV